MRKVRPGYQRPNSRAVKAQARCPLRVLGVPDGPRRVGAELGRGWHGGSRNQKLKLGRW